MATVKKKPIITWDCDVQFWGFETTVKARTAGEARRKLWQKLKKTPMSKAVNKKNSYVDKA